MKLTRLNGGEVTLDVPSPIRFALRHQNLAKTSASSPSLNSRDLPLGTALRCHLHCSNPCTRSILKYCRSKRRGATLLQRAERGLQGRIAEVAAASLFNSKRIKSRQSFPDAVAHRPSPPSPGSLISRVYPTSEATPWPVHAQPYPAVSPKLPLSAQQTEPRQCRPSRPRTATRACTAQTVTSNFPAITACLPLLKHTQTHTILNPSLKSSRHQHITMAIQTDMVRVTRSMPFPHHHLLLPLEGMHRREIVCARPATPVAFGK